MYYTYILKSEKNGSYYIGSCQNIISRFNLHNQGRVKSTKRFIPWELIYNEVHNDLKSARQREWQVKSWKKRSAIEKLFKHSKI